VFLLQLVKKVHYQKTEWNDNNNEPFVLVLKYNFTEDNKLDA